MGGFFYQVLGGGTNNPQSGALGVVRRKKVSVGLSLTFLETLFLISVDYDMTCSDCLVHFGQITERPGLRTEMVRTFPGSGCLPANS